MYEHKWLDLFICMKKQFIELYDGGEKTEFVMPLIVFSCCAGGILLGQAWQAVLAQWKIKINISTKLIKWTQSLSTHARKSSVMKCIACLYPSFKWLPSHGCSWLSSLGFLCFCLFDKPLKMYSICCFHGCAHASVKKGCSCASRQVPYFSVKVTQSKPSWSTASYI